MANTTPITGFGGPGTSNPFANISNILAPIYSMFGSPSAGGGGGGGGAGGGGGGGGAASFAPSGGNQGGGPGPFGISPLTNPDNSLTGEWYNLANIAGPAAANLYTEGGNVLNRGMGITDTGVGVTGGGLGVTGAGLSMLKSPWDFYTQLASADPSRVAGVAGPFASLLDKQMNAAMTQERQGAPVGGASAVAEAGMPQTLASNIGNFELGAQQNAVQQQENIANAVAGIGRDISSTGLGLGNLGQTVAGTGTTLTGQGMQGLDNLIRAVLAKMGINYQYGGPQTFNTIAQGIGSLLGSTKWTGA